MSEKPIQQAATLAGETLAVPSSDASPYNLSMETVPSEWVDAQDASPVEGDGTPLSRSARFTTIPTGTESSYIANITALGMSFITGTLWYIAALFDIYDGPWIATVVAAVLALSVTLAGGADRTYRAALCVTFYLVTLLIVLLLITHQQLVEVYGTAGGFRNYEDALVRTRLQDPLHLVAYGLGALVAVQISFLGRPTRRR